MKFKWFVAVALAAFMTVGAYTQADAGTYWNPYGRTDYYDAEKSPSNTDDDDLCWAATASNILRWTGWGYPTGSSFTTEDSIFAYYQAHFSDAGGRGEFGWSWWFSGDNPAQGWSGWSQEDVDGGGGFYQNLNFSDYYYETYYTAGNTLGAIDDYLHSGYGVYLSIKNAASGGGHAITVWAYEFNDDTGAYDGIWVTDSDDQKNIEDAPDRLYYVPVTQDGNQWWLGDDEYTRFSGWYIREVQALDSRPVPIPGAVWLLGSGLLGLLGLRRKFQ